ncbi:MAG: hypothetical protein U0174_23940 [Polyangiaceae bacterium]
MNGLKIAATCIVLTLAAPTFAADPTPDALAQAKTYYAAGTEAYSKGRYEAAVTAFEQAYALAPKPNVAFALAQAERKFFLEKNDPARGRQAIVHYKEYLDRVESGERRAEAVDAKADLEARLGSAGATEAPKTSVARTKARLTVHCAIPTAHIRVDGGPPTEPPFIGDIPAGKHHVVVSADGYVTAERDVSGDQPIDIPLDVPLAEKPALVVIEGSSGDLYIDGRLVGTLPRPEPVLVQPGRHWIGVTSLGKRAYGKEVTVERDKNYRFAMAPETTAQRYVAWGFLGAGAAGVVLSAISTGIAVSAEGSVRTIEDRAAKGNIQQSDLEDHNAAIERRDRFRNVALVSGGAGLGLALVGLGLFVFDHPAAPAVWDRPSTDPLQPRKGEPQFELGFVPAISPTTAGGAFVGRF